MSAVCRVEEVSNFQMQEVIFWALVSHFAGWAWSRAERKGRDQSWAGCGNRTGAALWKGTGPIPLHSDGVMLCWELKCCDKERNPF